MERGAEVVVQDVPLLFENGLEALFSTIVLVYVPEEVQLERLVEGRGLDGGPGAGDDRRADADRREAQPRTPRDRQQRQPRGDPRAG